MTITYDGTNILDNIQKTRLIQHESVADFNINILKPSRADGTIFIDEFIDTKEIVIEGIIQGTSQDNLEQNIDTFNELMNRRNKNLDISYAGGTRRYVCIPKEIKYNRDYFHLLFVPFRVVMQVPSGIGTDISTTTLTATTLTSVETEETITLYGSTELKPIIKLLINTRGNADVIRVENTDDNEYMDVDINGFNAGDYVEIDFERLTVLKNGTTQVNYRGKFIKFKSGNNNIKYTVFGSGGFDNPNQEQVIGTYRSVVYDNISNGAFPDQAQSFIPSQSGRVGRIAVMLSKEGTPGGSFDFIFKEDDNNKPAGGRIDSHSSIQKPLSEVDSTGSFYDIDITPNRPYLEAGKKYWLVHNRGTLTGTDASNFAGWHYVDNPTNYLKGKLMARKNTASPYEDGSANSIYSSGVESGQYDATFKIYLGDGQAPTFNISAQLRYVKKYL